MKALRKGSRIDFAFGEEYDGPQKWKIVSKDHAFIGDQGDRYTITNGVDLVHGVRVKDLWKRNWFNTLNDALNSEGLIKLWPLGSNIEYNQRVDHYVEDGSKYGCYISVYRDSEGRYERPVHYVC